MKISNEGHLDELLSNPDGQVINMMKTLQGDILILGIAGKMGLTLGRMAKKACDLAGVRKRVIGVSRFSEQGGEEKLRQWGIETIKCDLMNPDEVNSLPDVENVIFIVGKKFGTLGSEDTTWATNTVIPAYCATKFSKSRIIAFSTGCVYPLVSVETGGCTEDITPEPIGEYAQSCLGRERIFSYYSRINNTPLLIYRLNYAIDLRYGVLYDIAARIWEGKPLTRSVPYFNCIWQGDANKYALLSLTKVSVPHEILNITGPETISVETVAEKLGTYMNRKYRFSDTSGQLCYLNCSQKAFKIFGYPEIALEQMIEWQAEWIMNGGRALGKPTHFEVNSGKF